MKKITKLVQKMQENSQNVKFSDLLTVCEHFFERKPSSGGSHVVFKTPRSGDPRINIQKSGSQAKPYQVRQVLSAIEKQSKSK